MPVKFLIYPLSLLFILLSAGSLVAQDKQFKQWEQQMAYFAKLDSITPPPAKPIIFTGSSSITRWDNLGTYFPGKPVMNRGFGGSKTDEVIYWTKNVVLNYHPKQVVIYVGDNDIAGDRTPERVFNDLKELFAKIRKGAPKAVITYISIKPSPSRMKYIPQIKAVNELVKNYLATMKKTSYVDVFYPMLGANGRPQPQYFVSDSLHMTGAGYDLWKNILKKYIK